MTPHDLLANFEVLAEAPNGIQRLRELVLELAVRGKLLNQDPTDEPASELLKRIKKEKAHPSVVRTRKTKEQSEQGNTATQPPFDVPAGWVWCRLLDVCHRVHYGYTAPSTNIANHVRLVRITDIQDGKVVWGQVPGCEIAEEDASGFLLNPRDILIARTGGTIGKTFLVGEVPRPAVFASYLIRAIPCDSANASYMKLFCGSPTYWNQLRAGSMGTGQPNVNASTLSQLWIPFPPEIEQRRTVARVDELMALLDRLEAKRQEREAARTAARDSALASLREAPTPEDVETAWHRIQERFHELFATPEDVEPLRAAVLEMAVRGKLVVQDPEEESPLGFLANLEMLRNRGTRSRDANPKLPLIPKEAAPFAIPSAWIWTKFEFTHINRDSERIPLSRDQRLGQQGPYDYYGASGVIDQIDRYLFDRPLLLLGEDGANLALRSTPIAFLATGKYWVNNHAHVLDSPSETSLQYLAIFLNQCDLKPYLTGTAQPKLNQARMNSIPCPFPPLPEQHRIVVRVEEMMFMLDRLSKTLSSQRDLGGAFAAAAVHHLEA